MATGDLHDRLDDRVSATDLSRRDDYVRFLRFQYAARYPVEQWLAAHGDDCALPATTPLIARDLERLGTPLPSLSRFDHPSTDGAIGIAWALAGSHLGNRAMLSRLRKSGAQEMHTRFLADDSMRAAWKDLLPVLESPHSPAKTEAAIAAARAVFTHFLQRLDLLDERRECRAA